MYSFKRPGLWAARGGTGGGAGASGPVLETIDHRRPAPALRGSSATLRPVSFLTSFVRPPRLGLLGLGLCAALLGGCGDTGLSDDHEIVRIPTLAPIAGTEPMVRMNAKQLPDAPIIIEQIKENYYSCAGLVGDWFLKLVVAEMNFLARQEGFERMDGSACAVSHGLRGVGAGRIKLHLYRNPKEANDCIFHRKCDMARNVALIPTDTAVLRSYFLSDQMNERYVQHCLAPPNRWHKTVSCEAIDRKVLNLQPPREPVKP